MPAPLGWVGILMGVGSVISVLAVATPLAPVATAAYLPSLTLAAVFRVWAGAELWRHGGRAEAADGHDTAPPPGRAAHADGTRPGGEHGASSA